MTNEEAIKVLEKQFDKSCGNYRYQNAEKLDFEDALWVAISALRQQETVTDSHQMTNADRIRAMSDDELAEAISSIPMCVGTDDDKDCENDGCKGCFLKWLQQPAEEDDHA